MAKKFYTYDEDGEVVESRKSVMKTLGIGPWDIAKGALCLTAGGCASVMVGRYLTAALPESHSILEKAVTVAGVYFVTGFVGHQVETYIGSELEQLKQSIDASAESIRKAKEAADGDRG